MKSQAIVYHNADNNYLLGVIVISGTDVAPKDVATICDGAKEYGTFSSCVKVGDDWEVRIEIANRDRVEEFCRRFSCKYLPIIYKKGE